MKRASVSAGVLLSLTAAVGCVDVTTRLEEQHGGALRAPAELSFGLLGEACAPYERAIVLENRGPRALSLETIALRTGAAFSLNSAPALPWELSSGARLQLMVRFAAEEVGEYSDVLEVQGLGTTRFTRTVALSGRVVAQGVRVDRFRQTEQTDADILFVIDNSCSMVAEHDALTRNFSRFIAIADSGFLDYQIGVTSTDVSLGEASARGRLLPLDGGPAERIVTRRSLPSPLERFLRSGEALGAEFSSADEQGLQAMRLALSADLLATDNFGFVRERALLSVIIVSDEYDQSPDTDLSGYAAELLALKGGVPGRVTVSAVVGPSPDGCSGPNGDATAAPRYADLALRTGGLLESICTSNWPELLGRLSATAFGLQVRFPLDARPGDRARVEVRVDGQMVPPVDADGAPRWSYQAWSNSVVFAPRHVPAPGALIEVEYDTGCAMEDG